MLSALASKSIKYEWFLATEIVWGRGGGGVLAWHCNQGIQEEVGEGKPSEGVEFLCCVSGSSFTAQYTADPIKRGSAVGAVGWT